MHTIRLRGPWWVEATHRFVLQGDGTYRPEQENLPPGGRMTMPADWSALLGPDFLGRVRYVRTFNKPTGLEPWQRVFLVVEEPRSCGSVCLNDEALGVVRDGGAAGRFDITRLLADHNAVAIEVGHPELDDEGNAPHDGSVVVSGGLVGDVRLEIEEFS